VKLTNAHSTQKYTMYYKHSTCSGHLCGQPQGGALQRMATSRYDISCVTVCVFCRLAGVWPSQLDQINVDPKGNWYWLASKKIYQKTVHGTEC